MVTRIVLSELRIFLDRDAQLVEVLPAPDSSSTCPVR